MEYKDLSLREIEILVRKLGGPEAVKRVLRGELVVKLVKGGGLLQEVATIEVAGTERFVTREHMAKANVCFVEPDFIKYFLDLVEKDVKRMHLTVHRLKKMSSVGSILADLGDRAPISLAYFFNLLENQSHGETGPLLVNGSVNIAYCRDRKGDLWALIAAWNPKQGDWGWGIWTAQMDHPFEWSAGCQVLSH